MTRTLYDSTTAADIPTDAHMVAGYVDGLYAWTAADWARFPASVQVRIAIQNDRMDAHVLDIEPGNHDAAGAVPWVRAKQAIGQVPTVYCFSDAGPQGYRLSDVRDACAAEGVAPPLFWIAQWDNDPSTFDPAGDSSIVAKQYANPATSGGHYDLSVVADHWPGVDPVTPTPTPTPIPTRPVRMGQSADLTGMAALDRDEVGQLVALYRYGSRDVSLVRKLRAGRPGRYVVTVYPPVDPSSDETLELDAEPAVFVVDVMP